jgi:ABC-type bacteriocin/lantibiotic exporter with double-glycine peptidase domain
MNIEILIEYIDLAIVIFGVFLGLSFSAFTLFYSFMRNKKDYLNEVKETIKIEGVSVSILRKRNTAIKFISAFKKLNNYTIIIVVISFLSFLLSVCLKTVVNLICDSIYIYIQYATICLIIIVVILFAVMLLKMLITYRNFGK